MITTMMPNHFDEQHLDGVFPVAAASGGESDESNSSASVSISVMTSTVFL